MKKRTLISLTCPICLNIRLVRKDGAGKLCRSCKAKENIRKNIGKYLNITGLRSGKLIVISPSHQVDKHYWWKCKCDCGNEVIIAGQRLRDKKTQSCGCITKTQNGLSTSLTYRSWKSMIQRCYDTKVPHYKRYGAKGITVCERWQKSFLNFLEDMGERHKGMTLDRMNSTGNYCKENCRWATNKQQGRNRSNNHIIEAFGKKQTLIDWAEETGINWSTILIRLKRSNWPVELALTKKTVKRGKHMKNLIPKKKK